MKELIRNNLQEIKYYAQDLTRYLERLELPNASSMLMDMVITDIQIINTKLNKLKSLTGFTE